jgi:integrase
VVSAASYRCPRKLAKQSLRICGVGGRKVPIGEYFCVPKLPSAAFKVKVALDRSSGIASCAPALILPLTEHISFAIGLATELLRQGASLGEIGELLGHHSPQTTKIYTKVDLDALRTLALPWPGGVR